jgi:hypothetical protein
MEMDKGPLFGTASWPANDWKEGGSDGAAFNGKDAEADHHHALRPP